MDHSRFLSEIVIVAVEGGIDYWASVSDYTWSDETNASATIRALDNQNGTYYHLNNDIVEQAILSLQVEPPPIEKYLFADTMAAYYFNDKSMITSEMADVITQIACFHELIYG